MNKELKKYVLYELMYKGYSKEDALSYMKEYYNLTEINMDIKDEKFNTIKEIISKLERYLK
jgi:hypothetical protein